MEHTSTEKYKQNPVNPEFYQQKKILQKWRENKNIFKWNKTKRIHC